MLIPRAAAFDSAGRDPGCWETTRNQIQGSGASSKSMSSRVSFTHLTQSKSFTSFQLDSNNIDIRHYRLVDMQLGGRLVS